MASSWGFFVFAPPLFAYTEVCIYSTKVLSRVRNKVLIKVILFFEV